MSPSLIERFAVDSSTIKSAGYEDGTLVLEFANGHLFAYPMTPAQFEAFAQAPSKGRYFNTEIRGKLSGQKLTGKCAKCGSEPELIGEVCKDCGVGTGVAIDRVHKEP